MATPNDSIFELGDQFGISSPFGDWLEKRAPDQLNPDELGMLNGKPSRYAELLKRPFQSPNPKLNDKESMLVLSDIIDPQPGIPGSAKITISMTYRLITAGEGEVHVRGQISPNEFTRLFSKGNRPPQTSKIGEELYLKTLPSPTQVAFELTEKEFKSIEKKDANGARVFWNYYDLSVEYRFALIKEESFTIIEGIQWLLDSLETRGLIVNLLFQENAEARNEIKSMGPRQIWNQIATGRDGDFAVAKAEKLRKSKLAEETYKMMAKQSVMIICAIIDNEPNTYSGSLLYIGTELDEFGAWVIDGHPFIRERVLNDPRLLESLKRINSQFVPKISSEEEKAAAGKKIEFFYRIYQLLDNIQNFGTRYCEKFLANNSDETDVAAAGYNSHNDPARVSFVVLNPKFFGSRAADFPFDFAKLRAEEVLVHETGHNLANEFLHTGKFKGAYEYHQQGLQSNVHGYVYPSDENTISIINDERNRKSMLIR